MKAWSCCRWSRTLASRIPVSQALPFAVFPLQLSEESRLPEAVENTGIDVIAHLAAAARELRQDVFRAGPGWFQIGRRLLPEIVVADVDDPGIGDLELLGQDLLGALLVAKRQVVALDGGLEKPRQCIAPALERVAPDGDAAEQPRNLRGHEIDHHVDALLARQAGERLVERGGLDLSRFYGRPRPRHR